MMNSFFVYVKFSISKMKGFVIATILFMVSSCAYYPHLTDTPLIREKGDTRLEGGATLSSPTVHASVSYGLTEKIAVQTAGIMGADEHYYIQGAAGIFKNTDNRKVLELYGGFGYGNSEVGRLGLPGQLYGNHQIYFAQFNFGKIKNKRANMEYGFGLKSGYLRSKMTDADYYDVHPENAPYPVLKMNSIVIEPAFFLRFGGEKLKFQTGLGACWMFQLNHTDKKLPFWPINLGLGVSYSL
jgi:hypothetical protein